MGNLRKIAVELLDLTDEEKKKINEQAHNNEQELLNNPIDVIIDSVIKVYGNDGVKKYLEKQKKAELKIAEEKKYLCGDDEYINWLLDYLKRYDKADSISYDDEGKLSDIDVKNLRNLSSFARCIDKYATQHNLDYCGDLSTGPYYNVMYDGVRISIYIPYNSSDAQARILTDLEIYPYDEPTINFNDVMIYFGVIDKEKNGVQRTKNKK